MYQQAVTLLRTESPQACDLRMVREIQLRASLNKQHHASAQTRLLKRALPMREAQSGVRHRRFIEQALSRLEVFPTARLRGQASRGLRGQLRPHEDGARGAPFVIQLSRSPLLRRPSMNVLRCISDTHSRNLVHSQKCG